MKLITFLFTYPFIWILSRLPLQVLYLISDFFFLILYYVVGYRKKVVFNNIKRVFPEKSDKEIKLIGKKFFNHFTDLIMESVKSFSISEKQLLKRYAYKNVEVINNLAKQGKSIALVGSHHNNWEWAFGLPLKANINCYGAYTKIQNKYFEKVIKSSRMRFGYDGTTTTEFSKTVQNRVNENIQSLYMLLSDQSPQLHKTRYWGSFLGQFVPVHTGAEILSKKYNFAVVNINTTKIKRGYYMSEFSLITENASSYQNFKITDEFLKIIEKQIYKQPETYLWSHKRFKHINQYDKWLKEYKNP